MFATVVGADGQWVKRKDDGGFIKLPRNHVWVEADSGRDSLTEWGPISQEFIKGEVLGVVYPSERAGVVAPPLSGRSEVMDTDEIYMRFGIRK